MNGKIILLAFLGAIQWSNAQTAALSFEEVDRLQQVDARPLVVFIGTDWCRYCKKMTHTTFQASAVVDLLAEQYYFVVLDAEEKRSIRFRGHDFHFKPTGSHTGIHELAEALATVDGRVAYPSTCILNEQYEIIFQCQQFLSAREMETVLRAVLLEKSR